MFSLESPHRGDAYQNTHHTISIYKKKIVITYPRIAAMGLFQGTQDRVRVSRDKRAISVRATEGLLYISNKPQEQGFRNFKYESVIKNEVNRIFYYHSVDLYL